MNGRGRGFGFARSSARSTFGGLTSRSKLSYINPPPDITQISYPNLAVSFKSLSKKNDNTLSKALEDIRAHVKARSEQDGGIEDAIIKAWTEFYPRLSINNSRRIRELAHLIQHDILVSVTSRIQGHLPQMLPTWLAGTFDNDKVVSKAASDGINSILNTEEKRSMVLKKSQTVILAYVQETLDETPDTLSDERTMSLDDMKATYFRLIGNSIDMVTFLIKSLDVEDSKKHKDKYEALFSKSELLGFAFGEDTHLRRSITRLISTCVLKQSSFIKANIKDVGHALISEALKSSQLGSAADLVESLKLLTTKFPEVWSLSTKSKSILAHLRAFIQNGSQRGPPEFWGSLATLLLIMPADVFPAKASTMLEFMTAFRAGIQSRDEPKGNVAKAWTCYFKVANGWALERLPDPESQIKFIQEAVLPAIRNYFLIEPLQPMWSVEQSENIKLALRICSSVTGAARDQLQALLKTSLSTWSEDLGKRLFSPALVDPKVSKNAAQENIRTGYVRWFALVPEVLADAELKGYLGGSLTQSNTRVQISINMVRVCIGALVARQGKPYAAAAALSACMAHSPSIIDDFIGPVTLVRHFLEHRLFDLIGTPSGEFLVAALKGLKTCPGQKDRFTGIWSSTVKKLIALPTPEALPHQCSSLSLMLLKGGGSEIALSDDVLQHFIIARTGDAVNSNDDPSWSFFDAAATTKSIADDTATIVVDIIAKALLSDYDDETDRGLKALTSLSQRDLSLLISSGDRRLCLLTRLLSLNEEDSDSDAARKKAIKSLTKLLSDSRRNADHPNPLIEIIQSQLKSVTEQPLGMQTLANLARNIIASSGDVDKAATKSALFPTLDEWDEVFKPFYEQRPEQQYGINSLFGGALYLIEGKKTPQNKYEDVPRDADGHSAPFRLALYTAQVMRDAVLCLPAKQAGELLFFLCLTEQLVDSQIDTGERNFMYRNTCSHIAEFRTQLADILITVVSNSNAWRQVEEEEEPSTHDTSSILIQLVKIMMDQSSKCNALGFHSGKAFSNLLRKIAITNGPRFNCSEDWLKELKLLTPETPSPFSTLAILTGFRTALRSSDTVKYFCNQLVSVILGIDAQPDKDKMQQALSALVLLNGTLSVYNRGILPPSTTRLIQAVKRIASWTDGNDFSGRRCNLASESCKALEKMLPSIKSSAGEHWKLILNNLCLLAWRTCASPFGYMYIGGDGIPPIGDLDALWTTSMSLYSDMVLLKDTPDAKDDLKEVFSELRKSLNQAMLQLLRSKYHVACPLTGPFYISLGKEISKIPVEEINLKDIYPLLASEVHEVQAISFDILSKALPKMIDNMTMEVMVEKKDATIADELLSLLLNGPDPLRSREISNAKMDFSDKTQYTRRTVLLAWEVVLQLLGLAPYKVRIQLQEKIKEVGEIERLLEFINRTFADGDKLRPLSHFQITEDDIRHHRVWVLWHPSGMLHNVQWLSAHIYFLALKYVPMLVKSWYLNYTRAGKVALGLWTEAHFTPLVVVDSIAEVRDWRGNDEIMETDGQTMVVKLPAKKGSTISASYEIDDQVCTITLTFPSKYPLDSIEVKSVNRVAVPEKTWVGVLKTIEAAIRFSGGNVIDGIEVFRQNLSGFMKGHEQCAICYSIVSEDMKIPEKKCATCKNSFHSKCIAKWFKSSNGSTCPMCRQNFNAGPGARG